MLARRGRAKSRPAILIGAWVSLLVAGSTVAGGTGLGTLLSVRAWVRTGLARVVGAKLRRPSTHEGSVRLQSGSSRP
jgi:hypothetical protein